MVLAHRFGIDGARSRPSRFESRTFGHLGSIQLDASSEFDAEGAVRQFERDDSAAGSLEALTRCSCGSVASRIRALCEPGATPERAIGVADVEACSELVDAPGGIVPECGGSVVVRSWAETRRDVRRGVTPPSRLEFVGVRTPDSTDAGLDPQVMMDAVLGTPQTLADWERILLSWPAGSGHRVRIFDDGTIENLGRTVPDVHERPAEVRTRALLRQEFGDLDKARRVLERLVDVLGSLDEGERGDTTRNAPVRKASGSKSKKAKPKRLRR